MYGAKVGLGTGIFGTYLLVALLQAWPLPLHLSTQLTGSPSGDTGVYVWNTWVFRHEIIGGHEPFWTSTILPLDGPTDLSLHNYTVFADLVALPLQPLIGVVAAFNVVYLINVALAGFGMFLLARRVTGRTAESWIAGVLFACSPFLVARGTAHFSLAAAAPLPFFAYWLDRALESGSVRAGAAAGVMVAWAGFSDPYYAIYCVMLAGIVAGSRLVDVTFVAAASPPRRVLRAIDIAMAALAALGLVVAMIARGTVRLGPVTISMHSLYTPVLILTILFVLRLLIAHPPRVTWRPPAHMGQLLRAGAGATITAAVLLAPELYALATRAIQGRFVTVPVLWRSSAPGVDLLSFFLPNPNHPLAPHAMVQWLAHQPGRYEENVASFSFVALAVIVAARRWAGFRPSRLWLFVTLGFMSLALGPFLQIAGVTTFVPTPWTLLRYVPIIDQARMPPRFAIMALLGFALVFASALAALATRFPNARRRILCGVGIALALELLPAPRPLYSASVPTIYRTVAADPRPVRVLELPFGIRDGLSSIGDFTAASQFYQTVHGKQIIGGYLSRVEQSSKDYLLDMPVPSALIMLSERHTLPVALLRHAVATGPDFVARANIGYVVMDEDRVSPALREFAITALGLTRVGVSGRFELYVPVSNTLDHPIAQGHSGT